jgi:SnoaL-like domain
MSSREPIAVVRALSDAFNQAAFAAFRNVLAEATSLEEVADSVGNLGELMLETIDPNVEIHLHDINAAFMVGRDFHGWEGWLDFWRGWLEPWESYDVRFSRWEERGDSVIARLDIEAQGRGSGVDVTDHITQAWTVRDGKVKRLGMYARRRTAFADLARG